MAEMRHSRKWGSLCRMSDELLKTLLADYNSASDRLGEMHRAVRQLLADLTPDELLVWSDIEQRITEYHQRTKRLFDEINVLRTTDPVAYFGRLHASLEHEADQIKTFNNEIFALVKNHAKAVEDWKEKYPPDSPRQIKHK
jgi:hypothetical protein